MWYSRCWLHMLGAARRGESPRWERCQLIILGNELLKTTFFFKTLKDKELADPIAIKYHSLPRILTTPSAATQFTRCPESGEMDSTTSQPATPSAVGPDNSSASHLAHTARDPVGPSAELPPLLPMPPPRPGSKRPTWKRGLQNTQTRTAKRKTRQNTARARCPNAETPAGRGFPRSSGAGAFSARAPVRNRAPIRITTSGARPHNPPHRTPQIPIRAAPACDWLPLPQ